MGAWRDRVWWVPATVGTSCVLLTAADLDRPINPLTSLVVGASAAVAFFLAPRLHPAPRTPWRILGAGVTVFPLSLAVRPAGRDGYGTLAGDVVAISAYSLLATGLVAMLRTRGGLDRHAVIDGVIVCAGAGLVSVATFTVPAADRPDRPALVTAVSGVYPVLDLVLLLVLVNLAFTTTVRSRSFGLLSAAVVLLMTGAWGSPGPAPTDMTCARRSCRCPTSPRSRCSPARRCTRRWWS